MTIQTPSLAPLAVLHEADARMAQALENFFQRSRTTIQETVLARLQEQVAESSLAMGQTCLDWLNAYPESLSTAFADQFRRNLAQPETFSSHRSDPLAGLQLVDDATLTRQLAEEKAAAFMTEILRAEMLLLFGRIQAVQRAALEDPDERHAELYGPLPVVRALSRALDGLGIDRNCGTFLLECVRAPLLDTLQHTYDALNAFLGASDVPGLPAAPARGAPARRSEPDAGREVLAHIRAAAGTAVAQSVQATGLADSLARWAALPAIVPGTHAEAPTLVLRQLQQDAGAAGAPAFDRAVLDAMASLFECILDDPDVSAPFRGEIAQLQIPALQAALASPEFFSNGQHPARRLIDLLGQFSRRFPEGHAAHGAALGQAHDACVALARTPHQPAHAFEETHRALAAWLAGQDAQMRAGLAADIDRLEHLERQALGTRLALENLRDFTERYPAPESVLARLETAWVPYMASLYVAESGEGPEWRAACLTLQNLFLSLQVPGDEATREARLRTIPAINAALRHGLLSQGAEPAQLKDFFSAITATQEVWVRPEPGRREPRIDAFAPRQRSANPHSSARQADAALEQCRRLLEGDWVAFDPPYAGLATARVAWAGTQGHLLLCDSAGRHPLALDRDALATEVRAGRVRIPEQSLTRKALLRLKTQLTAQAT